MTDRDPLILVVSPYHLTTREAPAIAALQLADHAVTLVPAPMTGRTGVALDANRATDIARTSPAYAEMVESWAWCQELFREGVLGSVFAGDDAADDARIACDRIAGEPWLDALRPLIHPELFENDHAYLGAVSRDVLRGGPDPALSIPLAAGLDAFAARHGLVVARSPATSIAQKAEARLARDLARVAIPALVQGSADRILLARVLLEEPLNDLRDALSALAAGEPADVTAAARAYAAAYRAERDDLFAPPGPNDEPDEVRPVEGTLSLSLVELPEDAVFVSSVRAAAMLDDGAGPTAAVAPAEGVVASLVVKVIGRG